MSLQLYKSNKSLKGCAASFKFNSKDGKLWINLIKQVSYDEKRHIGSFKDGTKIAISVGLWEIGSFLEAFEKNTSFATVHSFEKEGVKEYTNIKLAPYMAKVAKKNDDDDKEDEFVTVQKGFGLTVSKGKEDNKIALLLPINFGEVQVLKEYLKFVLNHCFSAIYAADKKAYLDSIKGKEESNKGEKVKSPKQKDNEEYLPSEDEEKEEISEEKVIDDDW